MTIQSTLEKAEAEATQGRLWRAKEILASSLVNYGYSREIYLALANLFAEMGESLEAGKYYLLSVDEPSKAQKQQIDVFLARHRNADAQQLRSCFPNAAKRCPVAQYPQTLKAHLLALGATESTAEARDDREKQGYFNSILSIGCVAALLVTFVMGILEVVSLIIVLWHWI